MSHHETIRLPAAPDANPAHFLIGWPGWPQLRRGWSLTALIAVWFALVYGGADTLTALHPFRVPVHLVMEENIPFVPAMVLFYLSIFPLFLLAPFVLRTAREINRLALVLVKIIALSGIGFLLLPAGMNFRAPDEAALGYWVAFYHFADRVNLTNNLVPSLHVAMSVACIEAFAHQARPAGKFMLWAWAWLIALSTLLLHQHYLLDVVTGWILAFVVSRNARRNDGAA